LKWPITSEETGMSRPSLYKALSYGTKTKNSTTLKVAEINLNLRVDYFIDKGFNKITYIK
jgi:DNA-binding phage protein